MRRNKKGQKKVGAGRSRLSRREFLSRAVAAGGAASLSLAVKGCGGTDDSLTFHAGEAPAGPVIDTHRHAMFSPSTPMEETIQQFGFKRVNRREHGDYVLTTVKGITSALTQEFFDLDLQIQGQIDAGVTMGLLSFSPGLELSAWSVFFLADHIVTQTYNDGHAGMVAEYPDQLAFIAMVNPFRSDSVAECERCHTQLGATGINIGTSWDGEFLDSPQLEPLWEYAQDRRQPIWLHPPYIPIGYEKMAIYKLEEMVGRPFDTTMSVARLIFSGVFDRYPNLQVVVPHMGGGLPNVIGRLDFGVRTGYEGFPSGQEAVCQRLPSEYLRTNLYVDTMGFSAPGVRHCIDLFGVDRVLFGTDYPAVPISPREHIDIVRSLGLTPEDEEKILWRNANELFRLGVSSMAANDSANGLVRSA